MDVRVRTYRFAMTVDVEPDHVAYGDPHWAADAATSALSDGYGLTAFYTDVEPTDESADLDAVSRAALRARERSYRFNVTFHVDADHAAFDDPEWAADAAHGALTNEYGIMTVYTDIRLVSDE